MELEEIKDYNKHQFRLLLIKIASRRFYENFAQLRMVHLPKVVVLSALCNHRERSFEMSPKFL